MLSLCLPLGVASSRCMSRGEMLLVSVKMAAILDIRIERFSNDNSPCFTVDFKLSSVQSDIWF